MPELDSASQVGILRPETNSNLRPAVAITASLTDRSIVCLECGRKHKALKRHLALAHGMTPHAYRVRWDLPEEYPMVAPIHSRRRRELARQMRLGEMARKSDSPSERR